MTIIRTIHYNPILLKNEEKIPTLKHDEKGWDYIQKRAFHTPKVWKQLNHLTKTNAINFFLSPKGDFFLCCFFAKAKNLNIFTLFVK